jgi:glycerol-3-phosphate dehydrogenase (NAD(P)+)
MPIKFAILGDGAWGTAIGILLAGNPDHRVSLWSAREENARVLRERRENLVYLPGVAIPNAIELTIDPSQALSGAGLVIVAIPTVYMRQTLERIASQASRVASAPGVPVVSLAKGLEIDTFMRPTEILRQTLQVHQLAALSGPSHAEEVSRGLPTSVVVASTDADLARWIQDRFSTARFRVYTNSDVVGVELAGALKNIIGIAAGICDGLGFGDNAKAALLTRGLVEIARFGTALGARRETYYGLAGIGDLITTCISPHGRNRHVGERLAKGEKLANIQATMKMVAEGIYTTRSVHDEATQMGISMPITTEIYRVLYENKSPLDAVNDLMLREPTSEK